MSDNIARIGYAGMLPLTMADIRMWQDGVRFPAEWATGKCPDDMTEAEAWDALIHGAKDKPHFSAKNKWQRCSCPACRPNRRYR